MAFSYSLSTPGTYGFVNQGSYLESNNKGKSSSYALSVLTFTVSAGESYHLYLDCINYAEGGFDYGIVSNINMSLSRSSTGDTDTSLVKKNFQSSNSADVQTLDYGVVTTGGTIDLKFRKDGSVNSNNDSLRVTVRAEIIQVIPPISLSELTSIFYGTNEIGKVYYGTNLVYGTAPTPALTLTAPTLSYVSDGTTDSLEITDVDSNAETIEVYKDNVIYKTYDIGTGQWTNAHNVTITFQNGTNTSYWEYIKVFDTYYVDSSTNAVFLYSSNAIGSLPSANSSITVTTTKNKLLVFAKGTKGVGGETRTYSGGVEASRYSHGIMLDDTYVPSHLVIMYELTISDDGSVTINGVDWDF